MTRILTVTLNPALDLSTETETVVPGPKLRCAEPRRDPGGGGVNVSRALAFLGGDSLVLAALGGASGETMRDLLEAEGLTPRDLGVPHPVRESIAVTETATGRQFRFVMPGPAWSEADREAAAEHVLAEAQAGDLAVLSGSLPAGVPARFPLELAARLAERGARVVADLSGAALEEAARRPGPTPLHVLRMDGEEAASIAGRGLPDLAALADLASDLVASGAAEMAALSRGGEGTVLATRNGASTAARRRSRSSARWAPATASSRA